MIVLSKKQQKLVNEIVDSIGKLKEMGRRRKARHPRSQGWEDDYQNPRFPAI